MFYLAFKPAIERLIISNNLKISIFSQLKVEELFLTDVVERSLRRLGVTVSRPVLGVIAIIFGILLIIFPPLIAYLIGIFLIIEGILLLTDYLEIRRQHETTTRAAPAPPPVTSPPAPTPNRPPPPTKNDEP
jgi:hypothetical protein